MRTSIQAAVILLGVVGVALVGCGTPTVLRTFIHPKYDTLRPAMLGLRVEGSGSEGSALTDAVYSGLIARNYTVLAPGEAPGAGMGLAKVTFDRRGTDLVAVLTIFDSNRDTMFRSEARGKDAEDLAAQLLVKLPRKS